MMVLMMPVAMLMVVIATRKIVCTSSGCDDDGSLHTCFKRSGSKEASSSSCTFSNNTGFPKRIAFSNVRR